MINDLGSHLPMYKYVDDCTIYEIISKPSTSSLQTSIDNISEWTKNNNMKLNVQKTKELRISFSKFPLTLQNLSSADTELDAVQQFKLLGVTVSSNLTWNAHINVICAKASKRLYALRILKRSGAPPKDIVTVYCSFIRPVLEYACQVWHFSLPQYLSDQIESVQRRALRIAFPEQPYENALTFTKLHKLHHRRELLCKKLYKNILTQDKNKLKELLPNPKEQKYNLRNARNFNVYKCRTERFKNSFIPSCVNTWDNIVM